MMTAFALVLSGSNLKRFDRLRWGILLHFEDARELREDTILYVLNRKAIAIMMAPLIRQRVARSTSIHYHEVLVSSVYHLTGPSPHRWIA